MSIVSNASKLRKSWFEKYGKYIDVLAVSCDSCDDDTNIKIGRSTPNSTKHVHIQNIYNAGSLCKEFGIKFKINTVVCSYNYKVS